MLVLSRTRFSLAMLIGVAALLIVGLVAPASAKGKPDAAPAAAAASAKTEDNDGNDGGTPNNVVDNNDNAHPSGKDRSVEHGKSGNQGKAKADPDNDGRGPDRSNGGVDQPDRAGGTDKADQDGNNGCGNDDDFEDDNEGRCGQARPATPGDDEGKPAKPSHPDKPAKPAKPSHPGKPAKPGKPANPGNGGGNNGGGNNGGGNNGGGKADKIGICHRTGSMTNPWVFITVSEHATKGHSGHDGDVIGADSAADCPGDTTDPVDPKDPPTKDTDDGEVGGVIVIRPPVDRDDNEPEVIVTRTRRSVPAADRTFRPLVPAAQQPGRYLASTGSRTVTLASIAALALLMGGGLLGIRRFAPKQ